MQYLKHPKIGKYELNQKDKYEFLKKVSGIKSLDPKELASLANAILGEAKDSDAETVRLTMKVNQWDAKNKETWWNTIINPSESLSQAEYQDIVLGFFSRY